MKFGLGLDFIVNHEKQKLYCIVFFGAGQAKRLKECIRLFSGKPLEKFKKVDMERPQAIPLGKINGALIFLMKVTVQPFFSDSPFGQHVPDDAVTTHQIERTQQPSLRLSDTACLTHCMEKGTEKPPSQVEVTPFSQEPASGDELSVLEGPFGRHE